MNTQQVSKSFLLTLMVVGLGLSTSVFAQPGDDDGGGVGDPNNTVITRDVECRDQFGNVVDDSFCDPNTQPNDSMMTYCPVGPINTYSWVNGNWGPCAENLSCQALNSSSISDVETCNALTVETCASQPVCMAQSNGLGTQTMSYVCHDQNGTLVDSSLCNPNTYPEGEDLATQTCNTYHRSATDWGPCNNNTQTRTVICLDSSNNQVDDSYCNQPKPTETQTGYCSTSSGTNLYFWYKEEGQCDQGQEGGVCQGNGYTNQKVKRDGTLYERLPDESITIDGPDVSQTNVCYNYQIYPIGTYGHTWRISMIDCDGNGGMDLYVRDTYRDACSTFPYDQSCEYYGTDYISQINQGAECHAIQVQSARRDTFVCKILSGDLMTTVDDSFCTYAPKPADIVISCDQGGPGNPNYQGDTGGGYEPCAEQGSNGCDWDDNGDRDPDTGQGDDDQGQDRGDYDYP